MNTPPKPKASIRLSERKRVHNRKAAKRPQNTLMRAKTGANAGLAKPTRRGILRRYGKNE